MIMASEQGNGITFEEFCDVYKEALASIGVSPLHFRALHHKLENEVFDAGDYFSLTQDEESDEGLLKAVVSTEDGVKASNPNSIFLVDHAWTYKLRNVRQQICQTPGLLSRLAEMMGYSVHGECFSPDDDIVKNVAKDLWKYNQTYSLPKSLTSSDVDRSVWYVLDEFGSRIRHSGEPTIAMVPFYYQPLKITFSLFWPLADLDYADELTRDFAIGEKDAVVRKCRLLPWCPADLSDISPQVTVLPDKKYQDRFDYSKETLPDESQCFHPKKTKLKVFMDLHPHILADDAFFEKVEHANEADVIYTKEKIRDFRKLSEEMPGALVSQFPCQIMISCKDLFADLGKRSDPQGDGPDWLPLTFNLYYDFPQFVSHFQRSSKTEDVNCWICKPWNLARSLNTHVTNDLNEIVRLRETEVPMVVSKYVEKPVLFSREDIGAKVKFDFSFTVLLSSVAPLRLHVCEDFFVRFANKPYSLDNFDDYEKHFTVMNYVNDGQNLKHIRCEDFVPMFESQYPNHKWGGVERNIHKSITEFFRAATSRPAPYGIGQYSNSRSMISVDAILEWRRDPQTGSQQMQPILFECNFMPDFTRACDYYPSFMNKCFRFLYHGQESDYFINISDL